jgi:uncharacterized membrane protein
MRISEAGVFKWVVIVAIAGASVIGLTLLTRPLVGSIWGLVIVIAGCVYAIRWLRDWQRNDPRRDS